MSSGEGDLFRLYKTTDACRTWKLVFSNPDPNGFWDAIQFRRDRPEEGLLLGDPVNDKFVIYTTRDKGDTWKPWPMIPVAMKSETLFAASNSAAIFPNAGKPFAFVTGGRISRLFSPDHAIRTLPFAPGESSGAFSIASHPRGKVLLDLMIVGGDYQMPKTPAATIYISSGRNGVITSSQPSHGYRSAVAWDFEHNLWITVGPNGTDISSDNGKTWRQVKPRAGETPDADQHWNALSLPFGVTERQPQFRRRVFNPWGTLA